MLDNLNAALASLTVTGTAFFALLILFLSKVKEVKNLRASMDGPTIVGVVGCSVPKQLVHCKDFVDIKKARRSNDEIVVLHCRLLSYALKKCDFVCCDAYKTDEKIHKPNDAFWNALIGDKKDEE